MSNAEPFGATSDGHKASVYTLDNGLLRVRITDWGGRIVSIEAPDRDGRRADVLLGFDDVAQYAEAGGSFGALLGRNANRIARADLPIDGVHHQLVANDRGATLHGGPAGFNKLFWQVAEATSDQLVLTHQSPDGDQGFPGELSVEARYTLNGAALSLAFTARTTKPTLVSLSTHPYFNLAGVTAANIFDHEVTIAADAFLPTDKTQIPTGELRPVAGSPFDFRAATPVGARIRRADPQLLCGQGYDHYYVVGALAGKQPRFAARARDPVSGRTVEVHTTMPGLQFYTGNQLNGSVAGKGGVIYRQSAGLAFEPQGFPDAPHHANFPNPILRPGETYAEVIEFRFATD
ncbi:MAG TPA: aldose epimerase family protein [Stellaceae bacterium]|jgi:aldose 1-epimerase|nr:aldose epimerase family protein [Stellaceae bacterium]